MEGNSLKAAQRRVQGDLCRRSDCASQGASIEDEYFSRSGRGDLIHLLTSRVASLSTFDIMHLLRHSGRSCTSTDVTMIDRDMHVLVRPSHRSRG